MSASGRVSGSGVVEFRVEAPVSERDRLVAELHALGTLGLEESDRGFAVYFSAGPSADATHRAVVALRDDVRGIRIRGPIEVPATDWEQEWRRGLRPRQVAGLWIRPSWCEPQGEPELCIDPEQAFGSGEHATTRIALALLLECVSPGDRVLDVGTGSGVLALAALRRAARGAVACDLDAAACANAAANATRNGLKLGLFQGTLDALRPSLRFEVCAANLLWSELRPWLARVAAHGARALVVSGALDAERDAVVGAAGALGWVPAAELREAQSGDLWWGARFSRSG